LPSEIILVNIHICFLRAFAVWKELEKENKEFFDKYKQWISEKRSASTS